ncbi:hypothetical protein [Streptomyces akebiae]|uniref:Uncharacterized protein n=1 Tax=Streptomyces akebiae TaxID=2865673 RepID=A0ABX8XQ64_9ACTN|nr:hypothetical protein [Streptomyces akebiae]QYX77743.1 hypothetical protein K1J60_15460 [Streptomyces akebiae]
MWPPQASGEYVGRQLRLIPDAEVIGEITYQVKRNWFLSVDWIVVLDDLVLLVEVKSRMPTEGARLGLEDGVAETDGKPGPARPRYSDHGRRRPGDRTPGDAD